MCKRHKTLARSYPVATMDDLSMAKGSNCSTSVIIEAIYFFLLSYASVADNSSVVVDGSAKLWQWCDVNFSSLWLGSKRIG